MLNSQNEERVARERDFHNDRFAEDGSRAQQAKYYWAVRDGSSEFKQVCRELARDKDVLEYGCGDTRNFLTFAPIAKSLQAIDISDAAIERMSAENTHDNVHLHVMDAMNMTFADESFDLVFGSGIIHHLDTDTAAREVSRILRPGGKAVFWEPLGRNPVINLYRRLTPSARTPDEHPLLPTDFETIRRHLDIVDIRYYGLTTLAAVPLRGRKFGDASFKVTRRLDKALFAAPSIRHLAWFSMFIAAK
ncbi:class I SAM-dependent methyltransferase [Mycolicibacterium phlei]